MFVKLPIMLAKCLKYLCLASKRVVQWLMRGPNLHKKVNYHYFHAMCIYYIYTYSNKSRGNRVHFHGDRSMRVELNKGRVVVTN